MKMFKGLLVVGFVVSLLACNKNQTPANWIAQLPHPWVLTQEQMGEILPLFQKQFPDFQTRLKYFALWRVGTPYEIFKLGEGIEPDPDPILRYDVSDCTGHNLTSLAAVRSSSWDEALASMIDIHYRPDSNGIKHPSYSSRWHYTVDRITQNPNTVDISQTLISHTALDSINITLNQKDDGSEFLDLGWKRTMTVYYIPNTQITPELLSKLPPVVGVAFVKPSYFKMGIVMGHEGMIIDGKDLVHASQSAGKTVKVDFLNYYFPEDGPFFNGIMIFEFKESL